MFENQKTKFFDLNFKVRISYNKKDEPKEKIK